MVRKDIMEKMRKYCAYQDRCHREVRTKLLAIKVFGEELEEVMAALIQENFLNEERYARSFVRGKFRMNHWGRNKIKRALQAKGVSTYCIDKGMEEIDEHAYRDQLETLLSKYGRRQATKLTGFKWRNRLFNYALGKGYEPEVIREVSSRLEEPVD